MPHLKPPAPSMPPADLDDPQPHLDGTIDEMRMAIDVAETFRIYAHMPETMTRSQLLTMTGLYACALITMVNEDETMRREASPPHDTGTMYLRVMEMVSQWRTKIRDH